MTAHPDKGMAPQLGSDDYGEFLSWLHFMSTNLYVAINMGDCGNFYARNSRKKLPVGKSTERCNQLWAILAKRLETEGPWLMGENF